MRFCIQDPAERATYVVPEMSLIPYAVDPDDYSVSVDVLFVVPSDQLVQELPASRLTDAALPSIQIVDPERSRSWMIPADELERFRVAVPPSDGDDLVWFAMPSAREVLAAVPVFRKALVQHSS